MIYWTKTGQNIAFLPQNARWIGFPEIQLVPGSYYQVTISLPFSIFAWTMNLHQSAGCSAANFKLLTTRQPSTYNAYHSVSKYLPQKLPRTSQQVRSKTPAEVFSIQTKNTAPLISWLEPLFCALFTYFQTLFPGCHLRQIDLDITEFNLENYLTFGLRLYKRNFLQDKFCKKEIYNRKF